MTEPIQIQSTGSAVPPRRAAAPSQAAGGPSFADVLRQAGSPGYQPAEPARVGESAPAGSAALPISAGALSQSAPPGLRFSNHAQKRMQNREINLTDEGLARLSTAVARAEKRGGRESLVLMDELAFIVNIKERLVVTALDTSQRGEGVFTQIDSVVLADSQQ